MSSQIAEILAIKAQGKTREADRNTVFAALLDSDLPPEDKTLRRLHHEAFTVIGAGFDTTRFAMTVASYHILSTPSVYHRLREELKAAIPDPTNMPSLQELEKLPYLTGCIQEGMCPHLPLATVQPFSVSSLTNPGIRLSYGVVQRGPRISDKFTLSYKSWVIPKNTAISMDIYSVHHDEAIFPDSFTYKPERWLGDPVAPDGRKLSRYMVAFGRGTRSCLGINLAYAEMYIALANIYRRFEFELYETGRESVELYRDMFLPHVRPDTQGVRVKVL